MTRRVASVSLALALSSAFLSGCMTPRVTNTARTGVEQMLLSTAAERSLAKLALGKLDGRRVFINEAGLECVDKSYVAGLLKSLLANAGGVVVAKADDADLVCEPRAAALATDAWEGLFGVPALNIPIPMVGSTATPELAIFKQARQNGVAKLALLLHDRATGQMVANLGPEFGRSHSTVWTILLFISFRTTDIPELK